MKKLKEARPVVGITADFHTRWVGSEKELFHYRLRGGYPASIERAGGMPLILPYVESDSGIRQAAGMLDGLLLSGSPADMDPYFYGGSKTRPAGNAAVRHAFELRMARECLDLGLPVLGICGGEQLINVLFGGTLLDDIPKRVPGALNHNADYLEISHGVDVPAGSMLRKAAGKRSFKVNSTHHQSVDRIGKGLVVSAIAPDGVVEAVEAVDGPWVLGVQWHPEALPGHEPSLGVFRAFIRAVEKRAGA